MKRAAIEIHARLAITASGLTFALGSAGCGHSAVTSTSTEHEADSPSLAEPRSTPEAVGVVHRPSARQDVAEPAMHVNDSRSVALAHCEQQQRCGFIGAGHKYTAIDDCLRRVQETQASILNEFSCPTGSEPRSVRRCLEDVRTMDCARPFGEVRSLATCTGRNLCPAGVAPDDATSRDNGLGPR